MQQNDSEGERLAVGGVVGPSHAGRVFAGGDCIALQLQALLHPVEVEVAELAVGHLVNLHHNTLL